MLLCCFSPHQIFISLVIEYIVFLQEVLLFLDVWQHVLSKRLDEFLLVAPYSKKSSVCAVPWKAGLLHTNVVKVNRIETERRELFNLV